MPDLKTTLHLEMLKNFKNKNKDGVYGLEWGDPETVEPLRFIRDRYLTPYINAGHTALEIGVGGGRWTRYLLGFKNYMLWIITKSYLKN